MKGKSNTSQRAPLALKLPLKGPFRGSMQPIEAWKGSAP